MLRNDCSLVISKMRINPIASRKKAVVRLRNLKGQASIKIDLMSAKRNEQLRREVEL